VSEWKEIEGDDGENLKSLLEGRTVVRVEPTVFSNGLFNCVLTLDNGKSLRLEAVALHGMEAAIVVEVPAE
jgi:hypothetical protein